ncbi:MAG: sugar ABC transporter substrate-binding protein [Nocardioidaceae bacterium]
MMRLRITASVACVAALALVVAGCGGDDEGGSGDTLSVWIMEGTNPDSEPFFDEVAKRFEEETGATLDVQYVEWADAQKKFSNAIAGGTTPDVAEIGSTWTPGYSEAGALLDLGSYVDEAGGTDGYVQGLVDAGTYDDALYGMPWYAGVRSVVYRTDVFEKANVEPPTSWDELVQVGEKIQQAEPDMMAFPVPGVSEYGLDPFIWGAGGQIAAEEGGQWTSQLDSPEAQEGIDFYTGLATEHGFSTAAAESWLETDVLDSFTRGDSAMILSGSWTPKTIAEDAPELEGKVGAFPIPGPDGGMSPSFLGGSHLGIFNDAEDPDLAWTFVQMMTSGEFAKKWWEQSNFFPAEESLLEDVIARNDPLVTPFAKQMVEAGATVPVTPLYEQVQGKATLTAMLQDILSGDASVEDATASAAEEMNTIFGSE